MVGWWMRHGSAHVTLARSSMPLQCFVLVTSLTWTDILPGHSFVASRTATCLTPSSFLQRISGPFPKTLATLSTHPLAEIRKTLKSVQKRWDMNYKTIGRPSLISLSNSLSYLLLPILPFHLFGSSSVTLQVSCDTTYHDFHLYSQRQYMYACYLFIDSSKFR